jgi:hypothetical protein
LNSGLLLGAATLVLSACTTVNVHKVDAAAYPLDLVCIEENPDVRVSDFVNVLEDGFQRHGIKTLIYKTQAPEKCRYTLWYTARRGWDLAPFMNFAELRLRVGDETIALATYKHSGGFALNKWASTQSKMDPVLDELLANFGTSGK